MGRLGADAGAAVHRLRSPTSSTPSASAPSRPRRRCSALLLRPGRADPRHAQRRPHAAHLRQALIYIAIVDVDMATLVAMIAAAVAGAWLGAGIVAAGRAPRAARHGLGAAGRGRDHRCCAARRRCPGAATRSASRARGSRSGRRQLRARRAHDAGHRALRAVHDPGLAARHGPDGGVPDHDGLVRVPDAGGSMRFIREGRYDLRAALGLALAGSRPCCSPRSWCARCPSTQCAGW